MSSCNITAYGRRKSDSYLPKLTTSEINLVPSSESHEHLPDALPTKKDETLSTYHSPWKAYKGLFYTFCCSLFITLSSVIVKKTKYINPGELSMIRNAGVFLGCLPIVAYYGHNPFGPPQFRILLLIRGFLGASALYLNLLAYRFLPLAEAAIILSTLPALVMVTARIFLKEPCGVIQCLALIITITGILIAILIPALAEGQIKTGDDSNFITGVACAVGCVLLLAFTFVALRKMKDIHFTIVLFYLGFIGVFENAGLTAALGFFALPRCGADRAWVLMIAIFGWMGHCFLTLAIQAEEVGIISVIKASIDIVMAMVLQMIFFNKPLDSYNITGAALVILSIGIIGLRKWISQKQDSDPVRQRLKFLLF